MAIDQPLLCCICGERFSASAGGMSGHRFREGVCSYECQLRKTCRGANSIVGVLYSESAEQAYVEHHMHGLTDEEHGRDAACPRREGANSAR